MRCEQTLLPEFSFTCFFFFAFALLLPKQINLLLYEILARLKAALFRLYNELQMQTRYEKERERKSKKNLLYLLFNDVRLFLFLLSLFSLPPCLPCSFSAFFSLSL